MSQSYTLKFPFTTAAGVRVESIEMRRLKRQDLKAAMKYSKDDVDQEDFLLARLSGLTMEDIGELDIADSKALTDFFRGMAEGRAEPAQV
ncbi:phage tail assembly protein [Ralstonia pseudosolanacearum]|uniref:phage tail assembly protein n=1 Tax=Ralstonia pseudosolanacearum TaxID=1310165 RepID=UPI0018673B5D|nr:phage tail assembly protein [Ralstonia pseudosolanacearum]QOK91985.1 phage tail assembly protein [Ralstonia pseudosolanacearum]